MSKFVINGGRKLEGKITLSGNKNSALKLIPAALLADTPSTLTNVPDLTDIEVMLELIRDLGAKATYKDHTVTIDPQGLSSFNINPELSSKIRASVVLAAPLLAKFGKAVVTPPGGDQIGDRLLDTHFAMMQKMGVTIERKNGRFFLDWKKKLGGQIFLEESSVTATEMGLMMASGMDSVTIEDAASEPHIRDLAFYLTTMGSKVNGVGSSTLFVQGRKLKGGSHRIVPDHIEGGTFAIASAITGGNIEILEFNPEHYKMTLSYLENMGVEYKVLADKLHVLPSKLIAKKRKFQTRPWPGFPTDLMSPFIVLATQTEGTVLCHDWMYEWRMFFVDDLISMGANIFIADPHRVIISGPTKLMADRLFCKDIRAGISVILAAMIAEGESVVENAEVVRRGYENLEDRLAALGASIKKVE